MSKGRAICLLRIGVTFVGWRDVPMTVLSMDVEWHQLLAMRVIQQAADDARDARLSSTRRAQAHNWLGEDADFRFWCDVAQVPPDLIRAWLARYAGSQPERR